MITKRTSIVIITLLLLIVAVLSGISLYLFSLGRQYYRQLNQTRLDPLGLSAYPSQELESPPDGILRFVFFGDSRAYQWPAPVGLTGYEFINRGVGAQTSAQVSGRYAAHVSPLRPDIVLIQMCINDLKTIPLFTGAQAQIVAECKNNLRTTVQNARNDGAVVILTTIFPLGELPLERRLFWSPEVGASIAAINEFIHTLESDGVIVFDTGEVLAGEDGQVQPAYSLDFLHLSDAGYEVLNRKLVGILQEMETNNPAGLP